MKMYSVVGNKKKVTMESNPTKLKVVGNHCIIRVATNQGDIEVIGNDCRVEVTDNYGTVNFVGGNGFVNIGKRWKGDKVHMMGPCNYLAVAGKKTSQSFEAQAQLSPFSKDLDDVIESFFTFVMR
ncbi:putative poor imd response upon knock-in [Operophtera brumata]|uniref:Putative poor imd response upon knock-in n=1 Tax=Operophtera brumata TaxID=104452 RepID=A0A0L7KVF9_OPEBR|nr:putative poor imd response upon knock-in [Operophtera brumata]